MGKLLKILGILVLVFFGLGVIGSIFSSKDKKNAAAEVSNEASIPEKPKKADIEILQQSANMEDMAGTNVYTIHAQVRNNSDELKQYVQINATFYDKAGKIVGTGLGNAVNLASGAKKTIDVQAMGIDNADHYELDIDGISK